VLVATPAARAGAEGDEETHPLPEIVVTGTRTEYAAEDAPVPVQIVTRAQIDATSAVNVAEALDRIPGLYVRRNEEFRLGASTIRMQGADANKVAILLDGRRFRGGVDGVVDLRDIPVENIERIEVIRGPASSLYGSDAMGGVINVITRRGSPRPKLSATSAAGDYGTLLFRGSHGYRVGDLGYFLSAQHDETEIARLLGGISSQFDDGASDAKQTRDDVFLQLDYDAGKHHRLGFTGDFAPVREGPQSERFDLALAGDWRWRIGEDASLDVAASRYQFERENDLPGFAEDLSYTAWSPEARLLLGVPTGFWIESHLLTVGHRARIEAIDLQSAGAAAVSVPPVEESVDLQSPFVQDEILFGDAVSATLGASVDVHSRYGADPNPRLSVSWKPWPGYRVSAVVGRGYRAPDLRQLFDADFNNITVTPRGLNGYVILGNPDLEPETDLAVNLQLDFRPWPGLDGFLTLFRHDFEDLITVQTCTPPDCQPGLDAPLPPLVFRYENVAEARTQGVELSFTIDPFLLAARPLARHRVRIDLGYAFLDSQDRSGRPGFDGNELPFRPPHRFLPGIEYEYVPRGTRLHVWGEYEDRTFADLNNATIVESHWLWSFKLTAELGRALPFAGEWPGIGGVLAHLSTFVEGHNVFDEEFGVPVPMGNVAGRRWFLAGVQLDL
jgi:outer membrane receptor for ferrienterochelin and colicins